MSLHKALASASENVALSDDLLSAVMAIAVREGGAALTEFPFEVGDGWRAMAFLFRHPTQQDAYLFALQGPEGHRIVTHDQDKVCPRWLKEQATAMVKAQDELYQKQGQTTVATTIRQ